MSEEKKSEILRIYVEGPNGTPLCIPSDKFDDYLNRQNKLKEEKEPRTINPEFIEQCIEKGEISASRLQGYYEIGYPSANRIMLQYQKEGIVTEQDPKTNRRKIINPNKQRMLQIINEIINR